MVDAGLAGRVAGHTVPVSSSFVSYSSCRTDSVASTVVHVISISAVVALQVLGALETASWASYAGSSDNSETIVASDLASATLENERTDAAVADCG